MSRLVEEMKIVPILTPADLAGGAGTCESVCMKNYRHVTFIFMFGAMTGSSVLKVRQGATDGSTTADMTFSYRVTAISCGTNSADVFGTEATSAAWTITDGTYEDKTLVIEIDPAEMTDGYDWLTPNISAVANPLLISCVAILYPKYQEASLQTATV
jgi:hypothetical protein